MGRGIFTVFTTCRGLYKPALLQREGSFAFFLLSNPPLQANVTRGAYLPSHLEVFGCLSGGRLLYPPTLRSVAVFQVTESYP